MFDELLKLFQAHYPTIFITLGVATVVCGGTWFISNKYHHWTHRIKKSEDDCSKISTQILPQLTSINTSINNLVVYLKTKDGKMDTSLFRSFSPIQLTPLGNEILEVIGGKSFIDAHLNHLIADIDNFEIKTALDVQNASPIVINNYSSNTDFNSIKNYIFKSPSYKVTTTEGDVFVNLDFNTIINIMGIYLRNKYLDLHPNLNPNDIPTLVNS